MDEEKSSNFNDNKTNENEKVALQTDYNSNKKSKLLSFNSIRSFSVKKENTQYKERVENYYLYDKQIFDPIYSQIHKNIKDFEQEIKTGKKYLKPKTTLQKQILGPLSKLLIPISPSPCSLATSNLLSVSADLLIMDISYKWNYV